MLLTSAECLRVLGEPQREKNMGSYTIPSPPAHVPGRIYCNSAFIDPFLAGLKNVQDAGLRELIVSWDGCFNIRRKKGGSTWSLHSWGLAFDINAAWNRFGAKPTMDGRLVKCFEDAGFDWGGKWSKPDGMHFQLKEGGLLRG
jgi:hypothetical protein